MKPIIAGGIWLGALCCAWMFTMGFTGWYKDPALLNLFFLVIPIEIGVLIWTLRRTAAQGRTYGGQVMAGVLASMIGGLIIVVGSIVFTTVVFPDYFEEIRRIQEQALLQSGQSEDQIRRALEASAAGANPIANAITGFIGTVVTGLVASLAIAAFVRAK